MKDYMVKDIRNIAVLGHGSEGKTTLVESMLYAAGVTDRQGRVEDGNTVSDYDSEEIKRHISISASVAPIEIHGKKLNLIDVPGYFDFAGEMAGPLHAVEGAVIVISAATGISTGFEKAWNATAKHGLARLIAVSQVDREHINYRKVLDDLRSTYGNCIIPTVLPIGEGTSFRGVVDVLTGKAFIGAGKDRKEIPIPEDMAGILVEEALEACHEAAASTSEELMEKFFDEGKLSEEDMLRGLSTGIYEGSIVPVAPVSSLDGIGVRPLMYELAMYMPSPMEHTYHGINPKTKSMHIRHADMSESFTAQVFKTIADPFVGKLSLIKVISGVLTPATPLFNANADKPEKSGGPSSWCAARSRFRSACSARATSARSASCNTPPQATASAKSARSFSMTVSISPRRRFPLRCTPRRRAMKTRSSPVWRACARKCRTSSSPKTR